MSKNETVDERFDRIEAAYEIRREIPFDPNDIVDLSAHASSKWLTPYTIFSLSKLLFDAAKEHRKTHIRNMLDSPHFGPEVIIKVVEWSTASEAERLSLIESELESARGFVDRYKEGLSKRGDQVDKRVFQEWVMDNNIEPENIVELQKMIVDQKVPIHPYGNKVVRAWYRKVKPHVIFRTGRLPKKNR